MPDANTRLILSLYDAFARGDAAGVVGTLHPQVVWYEAESTPYADGNPYVGPQRVAEGVFSRLLSEWIGFTIGLERVVGGGDTVVSLGRYGGTFRATGRVLDSQFAHVWTVRDGQVAGFQQYVDSAQFARVTGAVLPPPSA